MTSVRSRLRLSSGSKFLVLSVLVILLGCTGQRSLSDGAEQSQNQLPKVYNPKTGNYEAVADPMALVDTVEWSAAENVAPPIGTEPEAPSGLKESYDISLLIPFNTDKATFGNRIDPKSRRFLHYYSGARLALADLEAKGAKLNVTVSDTEESPEKVDDLLDASRKSDLIIGPYNRECLAKASAFAARRKVPVVSPWTPAINPNEGSEYFVQANPGLASHAEAAMRFANRTFPNARFILVASPQTSGHSRMDVFQDAFEKYSGGEKMEKLVVDDIALRPDSNDLTEIYMADTMHVFVMPYYQRSEEEFVNSFMRKIHADHGEVPVTVIGMPQWLGFNTLNADYLEGLNTHVTAAQFVDVTDPNVKSFSERFLVEYGTIPEPSAWQAYMLMTYFGEMLQQYGSGFLEYAQEEPTTSTYALTAAYSPNTTAESQSTPLYLENKGIQILRFINQQYIRVE